MYFCPAKPGFTAIYQHTVQLSVRQANHVAGVPG
jgi:hypothetical protein